MSIKDRIKEARTKKGITQKELAELVGMNSSTIANYERGFREPDVEGVKKLAKALDVTGDWLIEVDNIPEDMERSVLLAKLDYELRSLNNDGLKALLDVVAGLNAGGRYKKASSVSEVG